MTPTKSQLTEMRFKENIKTMRSKTKRRLKWKATTLESGNYWAARQLGKSLWSSGCDTQILSVDVLKRIALDACEKHARNNPPKNSLDLFVRGVDNPPDM